MQNKDTQSYTILCVDDNENNLFTLNALLQTLDNIKIVEALNAKDALSALITTKVDLLLLDVQMPDINGFELAKMIKSNKRTKEIPIIFVTAVFKSDEFKKEGFEIGAVDYLTKPIDDNQLLNKISLYLKVFEQKNAAVQSQKRFYDIAQSISDGIYTLDTNYKTTFINNEALNMLGYGYDELIGKIIHEYIHYKDINNKSVTAKDSKIHKSIVEEDVYRDNLHYIVKKDGSFLPTEIVATPMYDKGDISGSVVVFRDKTHHNKILHLEEEKIRNKEQIIYSMIDMIESRDSYTAGHTMRVSNYCVMIAREMNYGEESIELLKQAALLHDIGKISTPDSVLLKPGRLNDIEYELIQDHLNSGYDMLSKIDQHKSIAQIMREHHEKYDGTGYPRGLKADEIMPLSRIMIVADAFDAMTTDRIYKPRKSLEVALLELEALSAKQFHPEVVSAALKVFSKINIDATISQLPRTSLEEQRLSYFYKDRLTNLFVLDYLPIFIRFYIKSKSIYLYDIKLNNFSYYNKHFGWDNGDKFLIEFSNFLDEISSDSVVFRIEGDDFLILSEREIDEIEKKVKNFSLFKKHSFVKCSIAQEYIEDVLDTANSKLHVNMQLDCNRHYI